MFIKWSVTTPPQGLPWLPTALLTACTQCAPGLIWSPEGGAALQASTLPSPHPQHGLTGQDQLWLGLQRYGLADLLAFEELHCPISFLGLPLASVSGHLSLPLARLKFV